MISLKSLVGPKLPEIVQTRTCGKTPRKSFIVDMDASVLRKLGKHARALYNAFRYMADGKSGELRFRELWYKAKEFDREAKMCERVRLAAMREHVAAGLVTVTRPRVCRIIGGRLRAVAGSVHYVVHRQPVPLKSRQKTRDSSKLRLQNCIPGSLLEMQSQIVSNPPPYATGGGSALPLTCSEIPPGGENHHQHSENRDDDSSVHGETISKPKSKPQGKRKTSVQETKEKPDHIEVIQRRAATILEKRGHDRIFVETAITFIDERSKWSGSAAGSAQYYVTAFETLLENPDDVDEVREIVRRGNQPPAPEVKVRHEALKPRLRLTVGVPLLLRIQYAL